MCIWSVGKRQGHGIEICAFLSKIRWLGGQTQSCLCQTCGGSFLSFPGGPRDGPSGHSLEWIMMPGSLCQVVTGFTEHLRAAQGGNLAWSLPVKAFSDCSFSRYFWLKHVSFRLPPNLHQGFSSIPKHSAGKPESEVPNREVNPCPMQGGSCWLYKDVSDGPFSGTRRKLRSYILKRAGKTPDHAEAGHYRSRCFEVYHHKCPMLPHLLAANKGLRDFHSSLRNLSPGSLQSSETASEVHRKKRWNNTLPLIAPHKLLLTSPTILTVREEC